MLTDFSRACDNWFIEWEPFLKSRDVYKEREKKNDTHNLKSFDSYKFLVFEMHALELAFVVVPAFLF